MAWLRVNAQGEGIPFAHSRRPSLVGSDGYSPTPLSCGYGEQQAAHGNTLALPLATLAFYAKNIPSNRAKLQNRVIKAMGGMRWL